MCIIRQTLIYVHPVRSPSAHAKKANNVSTHEEEKYISHSKHQRLLCWNIYWDAIFYNRLSVHIAPRHIAFPAMKYSRVFVIATNLDLFKQVILESLCK